jgi:hypothetical protein
MFARGDSVDTSHIALNDEEIAYLMNLLRNASYPMTTQNLIDALRRQAGQRSA